MSMIHKMETKKNHDGDGKILTAENWRIPIKTEIVIICI